MTNFTSQELQLICHGIQKGIEIEDIYYDHFYTRDKTPKHRFLEVHEQYRYFMENRMNFYSGRLIYFCVLFCC